MAYLKVRINCYRPTPKTKKFEYPPEYDSKKIYVMCYGEDSSGSTLCIGMVDDRNKKKFLRSSRIEEITRDEFIDLGTLWHTRRKKITNIDIVFNIIKKITDGVKLAEDDYRALDPKYENEGINISETFEEKLAYRECGGKCT
ncbi:unnamed protein product [marine sediment metagenome]|uniref:Uncharacterized protein n=1 Tax=marine sediment metagenome TaxID=412755 RepID=X0V4X8_9ZZZZ